MVSLSSLWMPVVVSAVIVFFASSIIHMVLKYHQSDFGQVPSESEFLAAVGRFNIPPGDYSFPRAESMADMKTPGFAEKMMRGPVGMMTVLPNQMPAMGKSLFQWFVYCLIISIFAGYVTSRALPGGPSDYLDVFRFAGVTAFAGYGLGSIQASIWMGRKWSATIKNTFDGLIYGLLTAGTFGWLWPM